MPPSKNVLVILVYALRLYDCLRPFPVGIVPSSAADKASDIPVFKTPLSMINVSWANTPSSSKKYEAADRVEDAPSCILTSSEATYLLIYSFDLALSFTNISISTPWPNASWAIKPVIDGLVITV